MSVSAITTSVGRRKVRWHTALTLLLGMAVGNIIPDPSDAFSLWIQSQQGIILQLPKWEQFLIWAFTWYVVPFLSFFALFLIIYVYRKSITKKKSVKVEYAETKDIALILSLFSLTFIVSIALRFFLL